jgi:hypothetical protein
LGSGHRLIDWVESDVGGWIFYRVLPMLYFFIFFIFLFLKIFFKIIPAATPWPPLGPKQGPAGSL